MAQAAVQVTNPFGSGPGVILQVFSKFLIFDPTTAINCLELNVSTIENTWDNTIFIPGSGLTLQTNNSGIQGSFEFAKTFGQFYYEIKCFTLASGNAGPCLARPGTPYPQLSFQDANFQTTIGCPKGVLLVPNGNIYSVGSLTLGVVPFGVNDIIGVAVDLDAGKVWFKVVSGPNAGFDPDWNGGATGGIGAGSNPATNTLGIPLPNGPIIPYLIFGGETGAFLDSFIANFGQSPFAIGTVPTGFELWPPRQ